MHNNELSDILKQHDASTHWEYPSGFKYPPAIARFREFTWTLQEATGLIFPAETGQSIQDAPFHSQLRLPTSSSYEHVKHNNHWHDYHSVLRFSSFGNMAAVAVEESIAPQLLQKILLVLHNYKYLYVPEAMHCQPYIGKQIGIDPITTWWERYFEWI